MTNLDSIFKSRDITLPTKVHLVKAMVFPVAMYGCESWTVKKAERWKIDALELWCWRKLLRVPWTARRFNQSILGRSVVGVHWKDWCWSWNSSTLATSWEELTHWKRLWCWEGLGAGGEGDDRGWDGWMASLTQWMRVWVNSGSWWWTRRPGVLWFMGSQRVGHVWATELNWSVSKCPLVIHQPYWVGAHPNDLSLNWLSLLRPNLQWRSHCEVITQVWDLGLCCSAAMLVFGHITSRATEYKLYGAKNNCVHAQLKQILDQSIPNNNPKCYLWRARSKNCVSRAKTGSAHAPCTQYHQRGGEST